MPEFVDGVVDIAQRGRSLGIHLIMATQRPAGVIRDNLRANTNLRVALRMADVADSNGRRRRAGGGHVHPSLPGAGIVKTGPVGSCASSRGMRGRLDEDEPESAQAKVAELRFGATVVWEADARPELDEHYGDLGPNDQKRLVRNLIAAASSTWAIRAPRRPRGRRSRGHGRPARAPAQWRLASLLGLADIPERQLQEAVVLRPTPTATCSCTARAAQARRPCCDRSRSRRAPWPYLGRAIVYGADFGTGSPRACRNPLPHVGSVVAGDDAERVAAPARARSRTMLDDRVKRFSEADALTLTEYRRITGARPARILPAHRRLRHLQAGVGDSLARAPFYAIFMRLLGEGRPLGVHAVATADRYGAVPTAVSAT